MAGSGAAAELSSFTAYAAEEETVITEDVNEEEETAEEPAEEAVVEEPAEEHEKEAVAEEPAEEPAAETAEEAVSEVTEEVTEAISGEAEEAPAAAEEAEEVQEAQTEEFLAESAFPNNSWIDDNTRYYYNEEKGFAKGFKTIDGVKYHFDEKTGILDVGFFTFNGFYYYASETAPVGKLATGFKTISGKRYYFWPDTADNHYIHTRTHRERV